MRRWLFICLALLWCTQGRAGTVHASDYDAFWLWSGVVPQNVLDRAHTVYVLQGQIESPRDDDTQVRFIAQGVSVPRMRHAQIWLAYRAHTLHWTPQITAILLAQVRRWRAAGNTVVGVQIDFDARTKHLQEYLDFLRGLRQQLPGDCRLGITGLLDWSSRISVDQVNQLRGIVDEVVVQTYQGRHTIPDYANYLPRVSRLQLPYRIGLIQGGDWDAPDELGRSFWFRGYVVFLQNTHH